MRLVLSRNFSRAFLTAFGSLALIASMAGPAAAQSAGSGWQAGPSASGDSSSYMGFVDQPANGSTVPGNAPFPVTGWFVDNTAQGWSGADQMQVWLGTMDGGGKMLAQGSVALPRPDVASALGNPYYAASGFAAVVQGSAVPSGAQSLYVYVHTPGKGWWFKSVSVTGGGSGAAAAPAAPAASSSAPTSGTAAGGPPTGSVTQPTEGANVKASGGSSYTITGTAADPTYGNSAIDYVDVWILGERDSGSGNDLGNATLNGDGSWQINFTPTKFPSTHVNIYVYVHSKATGKTTEIIRGFNITG